MLSCSHTSNMLSHCSHNFLICTGPFAWIWSLGNVDTTKSLVPSCLPGAIRRLFPMVLPRGPSHGPSSGILSVVAVEMSTLESPYTWFPSCTDGTAAPRTWGPPQMYTWIKSHWKWTLDLPEMSVCACASSVLSIALGQGGISKRYLFKPQEMIGSFEKLLCKAS